ncbi:DUF4160 domain-containing protein [Accumulibacter sp.]|uniref:DUF4160 domain-containing protein n=1 Tax=Accumulibacter sp. TaxID=2053492 RepID=UPI00258CA9B7|nr:DUF4160 domain-containing protein [Accumulibacter sp.]
MINDQIRQAKNLTESAAALARLLSGGYGVLPNGELYSIKEQVARIDGLTIHVYAGDHAPPHFHVRSADLDVSFSILDCTVTQGRIGRRQLDLVRHYYELSRPLLIETWNKTRPGDCPVGPVRA